MCLFLYKMESDFLFQKHDTESIKQMLELHLPIYALDHVDWLSCDCLKISMFATTIALRVAKHIANNLKNLENFVSLRGHETEFDLKTCNVSENRLCNMTMCCAKLMTTIYSDNDSNAWSLPRDVRLKAIVKDYNRSINEQRSDRIYFFKTIAHFSETLTTYSLLTYTVMVPEVTLSKTWLCCCGKS